MRFALLSSARSQEGSNTCSSFKSSSTNFKIMHSNYKNKNHSASFLLYKECKKKTRQTITVVSKQINTLLSYKGLDEKC